MLSARRGGPSLPGAAGREADARATHARGAGPHDSEHPGYGAGSHAENLASGDPERVRADAGDLHVPNDRDQTRVSDSERLRCIALRISAPDESLLMLTPVGRLVLEDLLSVRPIIGSSSR